MNTVELDRLAIESTRLRIMRLADADLGRETVNAGWDVRTLVAHLISVNTLYAKAMRGEDAPWGQRDMVPVTAPLAQFDESARELTAAIEGVDDLTTLVTTPAGPLQARAAIAIHATDMLVHGWDLAVATGQDRALAPDLCSAAAAIIARFPDSTWGNPRYYAQRVTTASPDPTDQLVALTGRDPNR